LAAFLKEFHSMSEISGDSTPPTTALPLAPPTPAADALVTRSIPRRAVTGWVLYDLANTIFSMGVVSMFFPLLMREWVGAERVDSTIGIIAAVSYAIIFVLSPLLGAMTDRAARRMPFLIASTLICVGLTALLASAGFWLAAIMFILANVAYQAGLQFYDAMLPEVSTPENRGRIGGIGIGVGYMGSFLVVGMAIVLGTEDRTLLFLLVAGMFLLFALPCFLWVRERGNPNPRPVFSVRMIRESMAETLRTLRSGREYPGLLRFLVGRVFYTDAINTVILIMVLFTTNIAELGGADPAAAERVALLVMLFAITWAIAGGFFWGQVTDRVGPKRALGYVLRMWVSVFLVIAAIGIFGLPVWVLALAAAAAGVALGGIWAADRPYMLRLTPPHRIGEFYGLYGMVGRFSAITGPATWALVLWVTVDRLGMRPHVGQGFGVLTLLIEIFIAMWILRLVSDVPRRWSTGVSM
jgi:MFS transporter, UMF1 family